MLVGYGSVSTLREVVKIMEDKKRIVKMLHNVLLATRACNDILCMDYWKDGKEEYVMVLYANDPNGLRSCNICVTADSGIALIKDVLRRVAK